MHNTILLKNAIFLQIITWTIFGDVHVSKQDIALTTNNIFPDHWPIFTVLVNLDEWTKLRNNKRGSRHAQHMLEFTW